jgi:hypothetical protein
MSDHQIEPSPGSLRVQKVDLAAQATPQIAPAAHAQVDSLANSVKEAAYATAQASAIDRATSARPERAIRSFLQLQRHYGNRYVEQIVARARQDAESNQVHPSVERAIHQERGRGHNLDSGVRRQMETAMGADFSRVRIHTGGRANTLNHALSARAFTTGQDIFFRQGAYQPGSFVGRELLAHELTHVVQQDGSQVSRQMSLSHPGDAHEVEAEQTAHTVMQRELEHGDAAGAVSRQEEKQDGLAMASRCPDDAQRQPEAIKDDDEKKKHHAARQIDGSQLSRSEDEQAE